MAGGTPKGPRHPPALRGPREELLRCRPPGVRRRAEGGSPAGRLLSGRPWRQSLVCDFLGPIFWSSQRPSGETEVTPGQPSPRDVLGPGEPQAG